MPIQNMRALILLLFAGVLCDGQYSGCRVPAICRRDRDNKKVVVWRSVPNPKLPPSLPEPPIPTPDVTKPDGPDVPLPTCDLEPGWFTGLNGRQYWISTEGTFVNYEIAKLVCKDKNARIATFGIRDDESRHFLVENVLKRFSNIHGYWFGYTDVANEDEFVWADGITDPNATEDWHGGQPDNNNEADCSIVARYYDYNWDDVSCGSTNAVLCER
ncbi:salivary C-type lectin 1-like isoform X1 [Clavelina lepadiformis]|uniref:salivary C-type lectin 1-like isoform X1 n=1 Tax=Clavelina lepadiformis TaxID=159417 RepID=UPI00404184BA